MTRIATTKVRLMILAPAAILAAQLVAGVRGSW
jgi:hypothetical protein